MRSVRSRAFRGTGVCRAIRAHDLPRTTSSSHKSPDRTGSPCSPTASTPPAPGRTKSPAATSPPTNSPPKAPSSPMTSIRWTGSSRGDCWSDFKDQTKAEHRSPAFAGWLGASDKKGSASSMVICQECFEPRIRMQQILLTARFRVAANQLHHQRTTFFLPLAPSSHLVAGHSMTRNWEWE